MTKSTSVRSLSLALFFTFLLFPLSGAVSIEEFLEELPIENVKILEKEAFYSHIYEVMFTQVIDHNNPEHGTFPQRIYISHVDQSRPVVMVTEGYSAGYYYTSEPAAMLKCNQIMVEHRYFGLSTPDSIEWEYLTTWQSAADLHEIINEFKRFYTDKWITTGISKGGQTAIYYSYYYPDDVDASMPYVAPLNYGIEDPRIYNFLEHVGPKKCRKKIRKFQKNALINQDALRPEFEKFSSDRGYNYELVGGIEKAFEYCVLEYSFAFWQWGYSTCKEIPGKKASPKEIIVHMNKVAGFDYFADQFVREYRPFYYQAYTEMGYYGYDLDAFKCCLKFVTDPGFSFSLPEDVDFKYDASLNYKVEQYLKSEAKNMIFIYGQYDTWSATAVDLGANENCKIFYKEKGSHRTRLRNMPKETQEEIFSLLDEYLRD